MNEVKRAVLLSLGKLPPSIFSVAIFVTVLFGVFAEPSSGPGWIVIATTEGTVLLAVVGVVCTLVYKKITEIESAAETRATRIEKNTQDRADRIEREAKEISAALTLQMTADREIRDQYHQNNLLALCHIMQAMKTGDTSKLEPELLFSKRLHLKQGD